MGQYSISKSVSPSAVGGPDNRPRVPRSGALFVRRSGGRPPEQLKACRCFNESMYRCERVEFRVRLPKTRSGSISGSSRISHRSTAVVSTAVAEVQQAVVKALAKEHGVADLAGGLFHGSAPKIEMLIRPGIPLRSPTNPRPRSLLERRDWSAAPRGRFRLQ